MSGRLGDRPVTSVLFDYGDTLMRVAVRKDELEAARERIARLLRERGLAPSVSAELIRQVHGVVEAALTEHARSGALEEIDLAATATSAYAQRGVPLDDRTLDDVLRIEQEAWLTGVELDPEALPTLDALRAAGIRVGLCSNAPYRVRSMHDQLAHVGLIPHLDAVTFSGEVGWRKPARRMFAAALEALDAVAAETVMVGDSPEADVAGAQEAGIRGVLFRPAGRGASSAPGAPDAVIDRLSALPGMLGLPRLAPLEKTRRS